MQKARFDDVCSTLQATLGSQRLLVKREAQVDEELEEAGSGQDTDGVGDDEEPYEDDDYNCKQTISKLQSTDGAN